MIPASFQQQLSNAVRIAAPVASAHRADVLYTEWYAPPRPGAAPRLGPPVALAHYRAADANGLCFSSGWQPNGWDPALGLLIVCRGEQQRAVHPIDFCPVGGQMAERTESTALAGWWATFVPPAPEGAAAVRVYWAVHPGSVFRLIRAITERMPPSAHYAVKAPLDLHRCLRPDGVVLYLERHRWNDLVPALRAIAESAAPWLHHSHPTFTLPLAPGISLAEDVPGESFGGQRCRWLAEAFAAHTSEAAMLTAAQAFLRQQGVSLEAPYRNPGSLQEYPW